MSRINYSVAPLVFLVFTVGIFTPKVHADATACQATGYTVVYVNGILTTREQADIDQEAFGKKFKDRTGRTDVTFLTGYNQTHVGGVGDKLKAVVQTYLMSGSNAFDDFDLQTILMQLAPQIQTQKILLVGHSQGTFYTNAMYQYLVAHGVSPSAISVYNVATPADNVMGLRKPAANNNYLTSSYDKVINYVREIDAGAHAPQPLSANINIAIPYSEKDDEWAGHHFQSDYLEGATGQIVGDIQTLLSTLQSSGVDTAGPCFESPGRTLGYQAAGVAFAALDTVARTSQEAGSAVASAAASVQSAVGNTIANAWYSVAPRPSLDTAFAGMRVLGAVGGTGFDQESETVQEYMRDAKAEAAAAAARAAAEEEALRVAPRAEAFKPTSEHASQAGAAAFAFMPEVAEAAEEPQQSAPPLPLIVPGPTGNPYQPGFGGGGSAPIAVAAVAPSAPLASPPATQETPVLVAESTSAPVEPTPAPPAPTAPASLSCIVSLSAGECIVPGTTATITWPDADNVESYDIYRDGAFFSNTTATTAPITITAGATSTFEVIGRGLIGMRATSSPLSVHALGTTLRVNEIAWSGTAANPHDQWIELRNMAGRAIDLSRIALVSETSGTYVPLAGTLAGNDGVYAGYYLIERREQATNVPADLISPFTPLAQGGEELKLVWHDGTATTTLDVTPAVATCSGWCAGRTAHAVGTSIQSLPSVWALESMERIGADGALAASWQHNDAYNLTARDVSNDGVNGLVYGTPRLPNSQGWPAQGWYCGALVSGTPTLATPQGCTLLLRFISPRVDKYVGYFVGTVGSSTMSGANSIGKVPQYSVTLDGGGMAAGDRAFIAVWENRTNVGGDVQNFQNHFTGAATSGPPHGNYVVFEWVKE